jgi:hypothetical protein
MIGFDWGFFKNSTVSANPLKGDEPIYMDAKTFQGSFANTLSATDATNAFEAYGTHDSRNVPRDCLGPTGHIDLKKAARSPAADCRREGQIIPAHLTHKNAKAYDDNGGVVAVKEFAGRSHYTCGEPGREEVAAFTADWLAAHAPV